MKPMFFTNLNYEALGPNGPFIRRASTIGELEHQDRLPALRDAAQNLGLEVIHFGVPIWQTLGLTLKEAKQDNRDWLIFRGENLPLEFANKNQDIEIGVTHR